MERESILEGIERRTDLDGPAAERAVVATLRTFGEHVSAGEAEDVAAALPPAFDDAVIQRSDESPESFGPDDFVARVAEREGTDVDEDDALVHVRAVMATLAEGGLRRELGEAREQLPNEFATLFETDELETG